MELVNLLTERLGVSADQASGGLGLLMGAAKNKMGGDFGQIAKHIPGIDNLIQQAPKPESAAGKAGAAVAGGAGGVLGAVGGLLGGKTGGALGSLGNLASLAGGFKQLGLSSDMIGKFIPVILGFIQSKGGDTAKAMLEKAIK